jgi:hypothetical protein
MTHTLHRVGEQDSLEKDYIVLAMIDPAVEAQKSYKYPLNERVKKLLNIFGKHDPLAMSLRSEDKQCRFLRHWTSDMDSGFHRCFSKQEIMSIERLRGVAHAVYTQPESVENVLRELKEADLGISVVASGLFDRVNEICRNTGLASHTVNMSLGFRGKTASLPEKNIHQLCTMCGHSLVSPNLARKMIRRVKKGKATYEEASVELAKQCLCNLFNTERAILIMKNMVVVGNEGISDRND